MARHNGTKPRICLGRSPRGTLGAQRGRPVCAAARKTYHPADKPASAKQVGAPPETAMTAMPAMTAFKATAAQEALLQHVPDAVGETLLRWHAIGTARNGALA